MAVDRERNEETTEAAAASSRTRRIAPGIRGVEWMGVLRCHCGLPYGDCVLSFSRPMFEYMGGYPDQPLMEDYEVMDWLRLRSVLMNTISKLGAATKKRHNNKNTSSQSDKDGNESDSNHGILREGLVLLRDRARCSPRRWNKYGVAYTSLINAICIMRYRSGATTEDLFAFYYHCNKSSAAAAAADASKPKN
jgi:hypothetical protein